MANRGSRGNIQLRYCQGLMASAQPSPNGDSTDTGDNALFHNVSSELSQTESRQGNTQSRREFACQRFNRHHYPGGKTGQAARIWVGRATHLIRFSKTSFAICSRFAEAYQIWRQSDHLIILVQPTRTILARNTVKVRCRILSAHLLKFCLLSFR